MRTLTYGGAVSLDGFLAGLNGSIDWLHFSKDVHQVMTDYWKNVDTILMGRKTYTVSVAENPKKEKRGTRTEPAMKTYVFSRTLKKIDGPGVKLVPGDAVDFVRHLKQEAGKDICLMGGGEFAQSLFAAGLVDKVGLNIHPISSRRRHTDISRLRASNKTDAHGMPYTRRWLHPCKLSSYGHTLNSLFQLSYRQGLESTEIQTQQFQDSIPDATVVPTSPLRSK